MSKYFYFNYLYFIVTRPNPSKFVFVRFLISKSYYKFRGGQELEIKEDNIYYLPFDEIKDFLEKGDAELVWSVQNKYILSCIFVYFKNIF